MGGGGDLLPVIKKNFNARRTLHAAIDTIRAINKLREGGAAGVSTRDSQARAAIGWRLIVGETLGARRKNRSGNSNDGWRKRVKAYGAGSWDGDVGWLAERKGRNGHGGKL